MRLQTSQNKSSKKITQQSQNIHHKSMQKNHQKSYKNQNNTNQSTQIQISQNKPKKRIQTTRTIT
jgi:hypothetical protein